MNPYPLRYGHRYGDKEEDYRTAFYQRKTIREIAKTLEIILNASSTVSQKI